MRDSAVMESPVSPNVGVGVTEGGCGLNMKSSGAFRFVEFFLFLLLLFLSLSFSLRRKAPRRLCWVFFWGFFLGRLTGAALGLVCVWTLSRTAVQGF